MYTQQKQQQQKSIDTEGSIGFHIEQSGCLRVRVLLKTLNSGVILYCTGDVTIVFFVVCTVQYYVI